MRFKPITAIAVLLLLVASLLVSGCTTDTSTTTQHDALLEDYIAALQPIIFAATTGSDYDIKAYEVTWLNSTSARLEYTVENPSDITINMVGIFDVFPTTQEATAYLNALNKTNYSLTFNTCTGTAPADYHNLFLLAYKNAAENDPQVCKDYEWMKLRVLASGSDHMEYHVFQIDYIILQATLKALD